MKLRNSVKAWIVEKDCVLTIVKESQTVEFRLPGGKQKKHETLEQALQRECEEELGAVVRIGKLLAVYEYQSSPPKDVHKVEFLFQCELTSRVEHNGGRKPDQDQIGIRWIPLAELPNSSFFPNEIAQAVQQEWGNIYMGEL